MALMCRSAPRPSIAKAIRRPVRAPQRLAAARLAGESESTVDLVSAAGEAAGGDERVNIDLNRLEGVSAPERELISRFVQMVQSQRKNSSAGGGLTIREDDVRHRIEAADYDVFSRVIRVPRPRRALIAATTWAKTAITGR